MNDLIKVLQEDNFPVLFRKNEITDKILSIYGIKNISFLFKEAINSKWIDNVYGDIYTLGDLYRKTLVSGCVLSQMIQPNSYVSTYYVLSEENWLIDGIVNISNITVEKEEDIYTKGYGGCFFRNLYGYEIESGIYWDEDDNGKYRRAKPLRALCDLIYGRRDKIYSIENMEIVLRIPEYMFWEELKKDDFDELHGKFKIDEIENFLTSLRGEIGI